MHGIMAHQPSTKDLTNPERTALLWLQHGELDNENLVPLLRLQHTLHRVCKNQVRQLSVSIKDAAAG
jgi:hypothetical protein